MVKMVAPVLLALVAFATPASADEIVIVGVARCHKVSVAIEELGNPAFTFCRSPQQ